MLSLAMVWARDIWFDLTNKNFGLKYTMHQEIGLTPSPTCPPGQGGFRESGMWPFRQQNGILATRQPSSASNRRRVFHMRSNLAIATLIRSRMTELDLSRGEFAKRLGYKNIAKGIRRIDALCEGDIEGTKQVFDVLPQALETSAETVKRALHQTVHEIELAEKRESEARDKIWRRIFVRMPSFSQSAPCQARFSWPRSSASRNSFASTLI